jgi:hypothetical protein
VARATSPTLELGPPCEPPAPGEPLPAPGAALPGAGVAGAAGVFGAAAPLPELPSPAWPPDCDMRLRRSSTPASAVADGAAALCARTLVTVVSESASVRLVPSSR